MEVLFDTFSFKKKYYSSIISYFCLENNQFPIYFHVFSFWKSIKLHFYRKTV